MAKERLSGAEAAQRGIDLRVKFRLGLRAVTGISVVAVLLLLYCLNFLARDSAEFYVAVATLILSGLLIASAMVVDYLLRRGIKRQMALMEAESAGDEASPWLVE